MSYENLYKSSILIIHFIFVYVIVYHDYLLDYIDILLFLLYNHFVFAVIFPKFVQANLYFLVYVDKCTKIFKYVPIYL